MEETEYFVSLQTSVVITEDCDMTVISTEVTGTAEYLTLYTMCRINRCRYNRVQLYLNRSRPAATKILHTQHSLSVHIHDTVQTMQIYHRHILKESVILRWCFKRTSHFPSCSNIL
jgi:hypothetical protein